jgi:hypothetical protein
MNKHNNFETVKGITPTSLRNCRSFYVLYPQIRQSIAGELKKLSLEHSSTLPNVISNIETENVDYKYFLIQQTVSVKFENIGGGNN